jgi:hypothetical protein
MPMTRLANLGHKERVIRVALGLILLMVGGFAVLPEWGNILALGIGLIALLTGALGYCPAWHAFGINSCRHTPTENSPPQHS